MLRPLVTFPVWFDLSPGDPETGRQTAGRVEAASLLAWRRWGHMSAIQEAGFLLCPDPQWRTCEALLIRNVPCHPQVHPKNSSSFN